MVFDGEESILVLNFVLEVIVKLVICEVMF